MPTCDCNPGTFDDGVPVCSPCVYPCATCQSDIICDTCSHTAFRVSVSDCDCLPSYYDDGG